MVDKTTTPMWQVVVKHEENSKERPRDGWKVYEIAPTGNKPITTQRGKVVKYSKLSDMFAWVALNKKGYQIQFQGNNFEGLLQPKK